jgi:hypothetical protein
MARPDIRRFVVAGNVLDPWDRVPWNDFPGKPKIFIPSGEPYENRQYKYIFDGLRAAELNTTLNEEEGYARLVTTCPLYLRHKPTHHDLLVEMGLPTLAYYPFDRDVLMGVTHPIVMKPGFGKNSYDRHSQHSYRVFPNGPALLGALNRDGAPYGDDVMKKQYFIQESAAQPNGTVNKILALVLINGRKQIRCFHVDEQTWTPRVRSTNLDLAIRRPTTTHNAVVENIAQKFADRYQDWGLKNCCLYIQAIIKDGVYYYTDGDICIPKVYAVALNKYLPEHLNFMYDQRDPDITIPTEYVVTKTLTSLRGAKETHLDLLESRAAQYNAFYWIQRFNFNPAEEVGRYMVMTSGDTEEEAMDKMNAWVEYLTVE